MKDETISEKCDRFNEAYAKACHTCQPSDWGCAALVGRQLVDMLGESGAIKDSFQRAYDDYLKSQS